MRQVIDIDKTPGDMYLPGWAKYKCKQLTPLALTAIEHILDGTDTEAKTTDRLRAAEIVLDRAIGKPIQQVNATITTNRIDTSKLSIEERDVLARLMIGEIEETAESYLDE